MASSDVINDSDDDEPGNDDRGIYIVGRESQNRSEPNCDIEDKDGSDCL